MPSEPSADEPSRRVVDQRIRNRVIEYLELAASLEDQLEYQRRAPVSVAGQMINFWADWVGDDLPARHNQGSAYTTEEIAAMAAYHVVWDRVADAMPDECWFVADAHQMPEWPLLVESATAALAVFAVRGRMSEQVEEADSVPEPSQRLVDQRVRNGVIAYLELAASFERQLAYQRDVRIAQVVVELIEMWSDVVTDAPPTRETLDDTYSDDELAVMQAFYPAWLAADEAVRAANWPADVADAQALFAWQEMRSAAEAALAVFAIRGRMSDDAEEPN